MIVFPAIDMRQGKCVRLTQGEPDRETVYGSDPVAIARRWVAAGAEWLHVVNLDGAFQGTLWDDNPDNEPPVNLQRLRDIIATVDVPIQFGGGVRTLDEIELLFHLGVARVVLGTVAVRQPELVSQAIDQFGPDRIAIGIDARDGLATIHAWQQTSTVTAIELGRQMHQRGVECVIYTDISRDGMLGGVNVSASVSLAAQTGLRVIASGGVASLDDVYALRQVQESGIAGVIIGTALYTGAIDLAQAIAVAQTGTLPQLD